MAYIREYYGVPAKRGGRVRYRFMNGEGVREGTITSATNYLHVRLDGDNRIVGVHPTDEHLTYLENDDESR